jgi:UDP-N-acetylglucosamine:LPS N-acetylglucosamine transferase
MATTRKKILAIASGGGHWVQLLRLRPAFEGCDMVYATVSRGYEVDIVGCEFRLIRDANQWSKLALIRSAFGILFLVLTERPDVVISTGAAPGYFGVLFGKWFGARVVWLDSIANAEELSLSGKLAGKFVDLWLTQWEPLAQTNGPRWIGNIL